MAIAPFTLTVGEDNLLPTPDRELMVKLRNRAAQHLDIIAPNDEAVKLRSGDVVAVAPRLPSPAKDRPNVAVVSSNGMDIDLHLGQASKILIYGPRGEDGLPCLLDTRRMPAPGSGSSRWQTLAAMLDDCFALLTASAGDSPKKILLSHGISVLISEDGIAGTVDVLYGGGKKGKKCRR
jgi:nitrogen fixation protein NifB